MKRHAALLLAAMTFSPLLAQGCLPRMQYKPTLVSNPVKKVTFYCDHVTRIDLVRAIGSSPECR